MTDQSNNSSTNSTATGKAPGVGTGRDTNGNTGRGTDREMSGDAGRNVTSNTTREIGTQGVKYLAVGAGTALFELALFQGLFSFTPLGVEMSNIVAVLVATAANFLLNRNVTFKSTSNPVRSLVLYVLLFAFNLTFSTLVISWLVGIGCHSAVAKVATQACIVLWNFVIYRKIIFI
ncbi:MAG: GtrA family protein [Eggerthellaceae bacterium]|nr:GtrA family protein [Eggerthellaceae bacterium]